MANFVSEIGDRERTLRNMLQSKNGHIRIKVQCGSSLARSSGATTLGVFLAYSKINQSFLRNFWIAADRNDSIERVNGSFDEKGFWFHNEKKPYIGLRMRLSSCVSCLLVSTATRAFRNLWAIRSIFDFWRMQIVLSFHVLLRFPTFFPIHRNKHR